MVSKYADGLPFYRQESILKRYGHVVSRSNTVGWSMGSRMTAQLVCDALRMAIWQRRPKAGLIVHSDRGSQYASNAYRRLLKAHDFVGSMSRKGNCWDNAVAESFFGSLKQERVQWRNYQTRNEAQQDVMNYIIMWYNTQRCVLTWAVNRQISLNLRFKCRD